jgi:hypothetical protein
MWRLSNIARVSEVPMRALSRIGPLKYWLLSLLYPQN